MKHKRNLSGFSVVELILAIVLIAIVGSIGWFVVAHRQKPIPSVPVSYLPKEITVVFKDGTTAQQALSLVNSYKLSLDTGETTENMNDDFTPTSYRAIPAGQFDVIAAKLKAYPQVVSFIDDSSDPADNRAGKGQKWVKVTYRQDATYPKIKSILISSGLGAPTQPQGITRTIYATAPAGQEQNYVDRLKLSPIVQDAYRDQPVNDLL